MPWKLPVLPQTIYLPQTTDYMTAKAIQDCVREDPQERETKTRSIHTAAVYAQRAEARANPRQRSNAVELAERKGKEIEILIGLISVRRHQGDERDMEDLPSRIRRDASQRHSTRVRLGGLPQRGIQPTRQGGK